jgi:hypothetical protein
MSGRKTFLYSKKPRGLSPRDLLIDAPSPVYLMTGTLTGLLGNRILLMSRSKTLIPCSPLTFLSLFIAITMVASSSML